MTKKIGNEARVYYSTGVNPVTGSILITGVRDLDFSLTASQVDQTSRDDAGFRSKRAGLREWSVSFDVIRDEDSASYQALRTAYLNGDPLGISLLDGLIADSGSTGFSGQVFVTSFNQSEPLDDMMMNSVELTGAGVLSELTI